MSFDRSVEVQLQQTESEMIEVSATSTTTANVVGTDNPNGNGIVTNPVTGTIGGKRERVGKLQTMRTLVESQFFS